MKNLTISLAALLILAVTPSSFAAPPEGVKLPKLRGIDGIYNGLITTNVGTPMKIPLQVALTVTGETVVTQTGPQTFEERNVIDGAFIIDDEGGPYGFSLVTYNLDLSQIDLRYNRLDATLGQVAASFRLVGNVDAAGKITGRVLSGLRGPIGTFELNMTTEKVMHPANKYEGVWRGQGTTFPGGGSVDLEIGLGGSTFVRNNPPTYEFTFTPSKMGYVSWNSQPAFFNAISIDYLRRTVAFSDTDPTVNGQVAAADCYLDQKTGELVGTLYGVFRGKVATFRLPKAPLLHFKFNSK
jgi:hypothetical protein